MRRARFVTALGAAALALLGACSISPGDEVQVTMKEWSITLSPEPVRSGRVRLAIDSVGSRKHDLALIQGSDVSALVRTPDGKLDLTGAHRPIDEIKAFSPGHYIATSPNLLAGHYLVICTLTSVINGQPVDHLAQGMLAKLTVTERTKKAT
jgi:hypothetical protein